MITEFMAVNGGVARDEDGDSPDWVEIFNAGPGAVDLGGYSLTDDALDLSKWVFPSVVLGAGEFLVVWASDKNRRDAEGELHANFKLSGGGEYLGLVEPDGVTVVDAFAPSYPAQYANISYGRGQDATLSVLVDEGAACRWKVPSNASEDGVWRDAGFSDGSWSAGKTGVGYEGGSGYEGEFGAGGNIGAANMRNVNPSAYVRIPFTVANVGAVAGLTLEMKYDDGFIAYINGHPVADERAPGGLAWDSGALSNRPDGQAVEWTPFDAGEGIEFLQPGANVLAIHGLNDGAGSSDFLISPRLSASLLGGGGTNGSVNYFATATPGSVNGDGTGSLGPVVRGVPETVERPVVNSAPPVGNQVMSSGGEFSGVQGQDGWRYGYYDRTADGNQVYQAATDFTQFVGGANDPDGWGAGNHWTGGAWDFNGGDGGNPPWTTIGSGMMHPNDSAPGPEHYAIRRWVSDVSGAHTLTGSFANGSANGDGTTGRIFQDGVERFAVLTDGVAQPFSVGLDLGVGDVIDFMVDTGPGDNDGSDGTNFDVVVTEGGDVGGGTGDAVQVTVTAEVAATVNPVASVTLYYRVMFGAEVAVVMLDGGAGEDAVAGDGIYTGVISTNSLLDGQMLRWRVRAVDTVGNETLEPPYPDPDDSPRYYGTVATNALEATSSLPILHWFIQNPSGANSDSGARGAFYFLGEFYDNAQADLHGQSTRSFTKKSYDLDFNKGARFRWKEGEKRVKDINLLTNWADKSKGRHSMAYEIFARAGAAHHFGFPVRVQQNGAFFSTADMIEDGDDRYLERLGLDPEGALYKMYNRLDSTGGVGKKTRKEEGTADLAALINGLDPNDGTSARRTYLYDHVDIAECVNYFAAMTIVSNRDYGHKNYYLYRDTNGTGEWAFLVWDLDLSWGHNWGNGQGYFDDTIYSNNPLETGAGNRLKDLFYDLPDLREMFMRRLRTVMDEVLEPSSGPGRLLETRFNEIGDLIDPPGIATSDADLDYAKWGSWKNNDTMREGLDRVLNNYLPNRRNYLYNNSANNEIPDAQGAGVAVDISAVDYNPASGNQNEEYVRLSNGNAVAVDLSGWTLAGGVDHTFKGGTVIPAGETLYVAKHSPSFRSRSTGPSGGQQRFVVGPYDGQLSARGETVTLANAAGVVVDTFTYTGAPTLLQQWLRVTEISYHPSDPTPTELAVVPGATASEFEFLELANTSPGVTLDLAGAQFVEGVAFTFPGGTTLAPGERIVVVRNTAAFAVRYGNGAVVAGAYEGLLSNGGEKLVLQD
ncbi:MAG: lamin tail domain-containing protein, partial [Verrucomicrobiales bacterium]|nr:lamin tail domain-containing protein [Verrucomicrobiales bacterium]